MRALTSAVAVGVVALCAIAAVEAQQRPSLATLDQRVTALEGRPTPEQIGMLRWFDASIGVTLLPDTTPSDMVFDGDHIWVADRGALLKLRASDGATLNAFGLFAPGGKKSMAFDGAHVWIADEFADRVLKFRTRDSVLVANIPIARPSDVAYDGTYMWVPQNLGGGGGNQITRFLASDGSNQGTFPVGSQPLAAAFDGAHIWVANGSSHSVTKLRASDGLVLATIPAGLTPNGLAFDGTHMWVTSSGSDDVRKIRVSDDAVVGVFVTGDNPFGIAFDGTSMWVANAGGVADAASDSVTKLRASDGVILGTFAVGDNPRSLVFDGAHMWVANQGSISQTPRGSLNKM